MYWRRRLTRLEAGLYAAVVGILIAVFLERALYYMELAERAAVEATIHRLNSAIRLKIAYDMLRGRLPPPDDFKFMNALELASAMPPTFHKGPASSIASGEWAFDPRPGVVVYRPRLLQWGAAPEEQFLCFSFSRASGMLVPTPDCDPTRF